MNKFKWHYIVLLGLSCLLISLASLTPHTAIAHPSIAQSNLNLNSDVISLRARITRLEQEVNSLRNNSFTPPPSPRIKPQQPNSNSAPERPTIVNPTIVDGRAIGKSDPLYERLATLLIELKEDVRNLDRRLTEIEQSSS